MTTTFGYGGELSSDEDIDRIERDSERLIDSKFNTTNFKPLKPTKRQIEETIDAIKGLPVDQDIPLTDDILAGLLDHFNTQRGPIVDSTRNLYKKIVLRIVRGEQLQNSSNGDGNSSNEFSNGNNIPSIINSNSTISSSNNNNNNNNTGKVIMSGELLDKVTAPEIASSDEDEPMPPASQSSKRGLKLDNRLVSNINGQEDMEVDSEVPTGPIRNNKPVDMSSSEEESEDESESSSDSDAVEVGPLSAAKLDAKLVAQTSTPIVQRQKELQKSSAESALKKTPAARNLIDPQKKPFTRSQRVAATRSGTKDKQVSSSRTDVNASVVSQSSKLSNLTSK